MDNRTIRAAADAVRGADALLIGAGAGMGVDSGLPDFRGDQGFWRAYPACRRLGLDFAAVANRRWFDDDPRLAWGFYGHRLNLYRKTVPHEGFSILRRWAAGMSRGSFVFTSNVDGQFQRAGFQAERIAEVHGSIHRVQCTRCKRRTIPADDVRVTVDEETMRARLPLPACAGCGGLLRPNILMFGDHGWDGSLAYRQETRLSAWLRQLPIGRLAVVELGAGTAIPSVRYFCERAAHDRGTLVRVNPRETEAPPGSIVLPAGALAALRAIDACLEESDGRR